jgi:DMSO/TMAO reductase YedYZ heme-binding membrane subunit
MNVETGVQLVAIYKSITQNYIFYIVLICCLLAFTKYTTHNRSCFILSLGSILFVTLYGYFVHFLSHYLNEDISALYKTYDNVFTRNKYFNWVALKYIEFVEFHAKTHHNTDINKQYKNIALEFINNAVTQGIVLIIIKYILGLVDNRVILLWAFFYATVHNINYLIVKPTTHKEHHVNDKTNYGIDIWDIIIGSKYDWNNIETHNHTAINLIVITAVIIFVCNRFKL